MKIAFKKYGDYGLLVQWPKRIEKDILVEMQAFVALLDKEYPEIKLCYHAYQEVYIEFRKKIKDFNSIVDQLSHTYQSLKPRISVNAKIWQIPVCYDKTLVSDLDPYLAQVKITKEELISIHTNENYLIHFIGFLPGFLYLGGMDSRLAISRKKIPSKKILKGTVAIGGAQTGIYPQQSPGGWYGIGYTPLSLFDPLLENPCFAMAGDYVRFHAIDHKELAALENSILKGEYTIQCDTYAY